MVKTEISNFGKQESTQLSSSDHKGSTDSSKQVTMRKHNVLLEHFGQELQYM